jgi:sugar phosphate isomerase/epimerase
MARADELGVVIAVENVRACGHVVYLLERYPQMGFCWDVGHEACFQHGWQSMPMVGSRIAALHLHDNRLVANGDDHLLPYDGKIDMERVARQLAESGYEKTMMLETAIYRDMDADAYFARAASAASKMAERVDFYRKRVGV